MIYLSGHDQSMHSGENGSYENRSHLVSNARKTTLPSSRAGVLLFLGPPDWEGQGHLFQEALPGQAGPWRQATPQLSTSSRPNCSPAVAISPPAHTSAKQISGMDQQHLSTTTLPRLCDAVLRPGWTMPKICRDCAQLAWGQLPQETAWPAQRQPPCCPLPPVWSSGRPVRKNGHY